MLNNSRVFNKHAKIYQITKNFRRHSYRAIRKFQQFTELVYLPRLTHITNPHNKILLNWNLHVWKIRLSRWCFRLLANDTCRSVEPINLHSSSSPLTWRSSAVVERQRDCVCRWNFSVLLRGHSRSLKMILFENLGTVSYLHFIQLRTYLAVSTQYTNVTDTQPPSQTPRDSKNWAMQPCCGKNQITESS